MPADSHGSIGEKPRNPRAKAARGAPAVQERVAELDSATGVPMPFKIEAYFVSADPEVHEKQVHTILAEHRVKGNEFFDVPFSKALQVVESVCRQPPVYSSTLNHRGPGWKSEYDD